MFFHLSPNLAYVDLSFNSIPGASTYRLPESDEEERIKSDARASGASPRIKHYVANRQQGAPERLNPRGMDSALQALWAL